MTTTVHTTATTMDDRDTWWAVNRAAPATYVYFTYVQSALGDMDAAKAEHDWATVVASAEDALTSLGYCRLVLHGLEGNTYDGEVALHLATATPDGPLAAIAAAQRALPDPTSASERDADTAQRRVLALAEALSAEFPSAVPVVRTSEGFFPGVRIAKDYENLRKRLGLPPLDWITWLH